MQEIQVESFQIDMVPSHPFKSSLHCHSYESLERSILFGRRLIRSPFCQSHLNGSSWSGGTVWSDAIQEWCNFGTGCSSGSTRFWLDTVLGWCRCSLTWFRLETVLDWSGGTVWTVPSGCWNAGGVRQGRSWPLHVGIVAGCHFVRRSKTNTSRQVASSTLTAHSQASRRLASEAWPQHGMDHDMEWTITWNGPPRTFMYMYHIMYGPDVKHPQAVKL